MPDVPGNARMDGSAGLESLLTQYPPLTPPPSGSPPFGAPPPRPRGNAAAVASLVFGILGCVPEITGLLAILLGVIGLRRARDPGTGGKGLAAAGVALGAVSVVLWSIALGFAAWMWTGSAPARAVARQYLRDFSHQNIPAILSASTSSVTEPQVQVLSQRLRNLGNFQDVRFTGVYFNFSTGSPQWTLTRKATYANGTAFFTIRVIQYGDAWKVDAFRIQGQLRNGQTAPGNVEVWRFDGQPNNLIWRT